MREHPLSPPFLHCSEGLSPGESKKGWPRATTFFSSRNEEEEEEEGMAPDGTLSGYLQRKGTTSRYLGITKLEPCFKFPVEADIMFISSLTILGFFKECRGEKDQLDL